MKRQGFMTVQTITKISGNDYSIEDVISNLQARNSIMSDKLFSESFGKAFHRDVLILMPQLFEGVSASSQEGLVVTKLEGFSDYVTENDFVCKSRIIAEMILCGSINITLSAEVHYSKHGDGSEVDTWTVLVNGEDIEDLFELEQKLEDAIYSFIDSHYQGSDYDSTAKPLSQKEIDDIASILKM
jgi:hypothetical protein